MAYVESTSVRLSIRLPVCELMSAIKPFARFCEIRCLGSLQQVTKKPLCISVQWQQHFSCLSVCLYVCLYV
jgi:hypothetical protein